MSLIPLSIRHHWSDWKLPGVRSKAVNSMIECERGDAVPIIVAPGKLWLTVTHVFVAGLDLSIRDGARMVTFGVRVVTFKPLR